MKASNYTFLIEHQRAISTKRKIKATILFITVFFISIASIFSLFYFVKTEKKDNIHDEHDDEDIHIRDVFIPTNITVQDFLKVRCNLKEDKESIIQVEGNVVAYPPHQKQINLFKMISVSISRCRRNIANNGYEVIMREITLFLDQDTEEKLLTWSNPWSGGTMNVAHTAVAFSYTIFDNDSSISFEVYGNMITMKRESSVYERNKLSGDDGQLTPYMLQEFVRVNEYNQYTTPLVELSNQKESFTPTTITSRHYSSSYYPWMKMEDTHGYITVSATGGRITSVDKLKPVLASELINRLPSSCMHAPTEYIKDRQSNLAEMDYFRRNFNDFMKGEEFPLLNSCDTI